MNTVKVPVGSWRVAPTAFVVMVAGMIATPLFGTGGDERRVLAHVVVASFFIAAVASAQQAFGSGALFAAAMIVIVTFLVEVLGSTTGFPFGAYDYTDSLDPQLFGVPVIVSFAWAGITLVVHGALGVSTTAPPAIGGSTAVSRVARIVMMAGAITAWDLFLDPQMVGEGYWKWEPASLAYREIPLVNYLGWLITASVASAIALAMCKPAATHAATVDVQQVQAHTVFARAVYATLTALSTIGFLFFFDDALVAVVGGIGMGTFVVASYVTRPRI